MNLISAEPDISIPSISSLIPVTSAELKPSVSEAKDLPQRHFYLATDATRMVANDTGAPISIAGCLRIGRFAIIFQRQLVDDECSCPVRKKPKAMTGRRKGQYYGIVSQKISGHFGGLGEFRPGVSSQC